MFARFALISAAITAASPPVTVHYKIEQKIENKVDLSGFGQGEQVETRDATWHVTITYTDSAGGRVVHAVLDSAKMEGGMMPIPQASMSTGPPVYVSPVSFPYGPSTSALVPGLSRATRALPSPRSLTVIRSTPVCGVAESEYGCDRDQPGPFRNRHWKNCPARTGSLSSRRPRR